MGQTNKFATVKPSEGTIFQLLNLYADDFREIHEGKKAAYVTTVDVEYQNSAQNKKSIIYYFFVFIPNEQTTVKELFSVELDNDNCDSGVFRSGYVHLDDYKKLPPIESFKNKDELEKIIDKHIAENKMWREVFAILAAY